MSDGMSDGRNYGPFLSKHGPPIISRDGKPVPVDTCENYRRDGETEIKSRFCSKFEMFSNVHAPTCQFFRG